MPEGRYADGHVSQSECVKKLETQDEYCVSYVSQSGEYVYEYVDGLGSQTEYLD